MPKHRILVVDDDALNRDVLCRRLKREGFAVEEAYSGSCALAMLKENFFNLVLLDIVMPDINGIEVLKQIKSDKTLLASPSVMMLSSQRNENTVSTCLKLGADDYLNKPFIMSLVKSRIERCLNGTPAEGNITNKDLTGMQILIVDDNEMNRNLLKRQLKKRGYNIAVANSGSQAIVHISENPVDLVLLDIDMPGMDGIETLRRIRSDEHSKHIPVIMVTAGNDAKTMETCLNHGANDYIPKPLDIDFLNARIRSSLSAQI